MTVRPVDEVALRECPACQLTVPTATFCSSCGADLRISAGGHLLRPKVFAAAPGEPIFLPMVTSTLFPRLRRRARMPFRHGLFLLLTALVAFSLLRLLGPFVITTSLGAEMLFVLYLWQSDVFRDIPRPALIVAPLLGAAFGVAWWLWTGGMIADSYGIPLAAGSQLLHVIDTGLITTLAGIVPMLLPAVVVRFLRLPRREALDGFVIGALGALSYSAAGTLTWLAPQFATDLLTDYGPWRLLEEAILYGFIDPLTTASVGGLLGLTLWFQPKRASGHRAGWSRAALVLLTVVAGGIYLAVYVVDAAQLDRTAEIAINLALSAVALVALRLGVQFALLHEIPDPSTGDPVGCVYCNQVVPDMPFCPLCGVAARAASRSVRLQRRAAAAAEPA